MLTLTGTLRGAVEVGGGVNRKGERVPVRSVIQVEVQDDRGLFSIVSLTVPDHRPYAGQEGSTVAIPVRAFAPGAQVQFYSAER